MHQLEDQSIIVSLAFPNYLQDYEQTQEDKDDAKQNEELTTSCANSEPSPHNSRSTLAKNESKGNERKATLTYGATSLDVLNFSTNHAFIEQLLVEPSFDLPLSQDDLLDFSCDKDDLCDNTAAIHVLKPHTCTELKHVNHIDSDMNELKLLSSLKTLGYIEFNVLCNLSDLEEQLFEHAELPWCSRHTYHAIVKYDSNGKYLIYWVYICANLSFPFVV